MEPLRYAPQRTRFRISSSSADMPFVDGITWSPRSMIMLKEFPAYSQDRLRSSHLEKSAFDMIRSACKVVISLLSKLYRRSSVNRWRNLHPAVVISSGFERISGRLECFETTNIMALSRSLEKLGPPHAMSRINTGR